ncbi:MAG: hypothetical protein GXP62_03965 [Oligoflexia bacterium]|nr:hypothetical protein [Oligoflexia bacterium]
MPKSVVVIGGGVSGLTAAYHLVELWQARRLADPQSEPLHIQLIAPLVPTQDAKAGGLGGKAMSRTYDGPTDNEGHPRLPFYGPMMPKKGTVPHGYHVMWAYPNLRRFLGDGAADEPSPAFDGGLLRPKGGARALSVFQGLIDDPSPGGPGIALMGLSDPDHPETATLPVTQALFRIKDTPLGGVFLRAFATVFAHVADGVDPFFFADLFYAHEVDLDMRLALIAASLLAHTTDPENDLVERDGEPLHLWEIEYDEWLDMTLAAWSSPLIDALRDQPLAGWLADLDARGWLLEAQVEGDDRPHLLDRLARALLPAGLEARYDDYRLVFSETERVLRGVPGAAKRLASGQYKVSGSLHFRFGPDATFTSPYSYDAASAVRSLAFVFTSPRSARIWSADGGQMNRVWVRLWKRLKDAAAATNGGVQLTVIPGRVTGLARDGQGMAVECTPIVGHPWHAHSDLLWPHVPRLDAWYSVGDSPQRMVADAVITAVAAPSLEAILPQDAPQARAAIVPLKPHHNTTLEIVIWLKERVEYSTFARKGLANSSITGLEGGWCLLADYSQGLWSPDMLAAEDPFGDGAFVGSILESCGGFDDLFACRTRDDAYGWPETVKQAIADLLGRPEYFDLLDERPWAFDESGWQGRRAGGQWSPRHAVSASAHDDWFVAGRWLAWQFLRQIAQIQSLGPRAVRQFADAARLLDPRSVERAEILAPPATLTDQIRYVVMRNAKPRNRIFSPSAGTWPIRPVSGVPLPGLDRVFPAGDWTRNGLDVICMEGATLSAMRAARGVYRTLTGQRPLPSVHGPIQVMPDASWYVGLDPLARGDADRASALHALGVRH